MKYIYVRGGDKTAPVIARKAGALYGTRDDYTIYDDIHMLDANWKACDWQRMLSIIAEHKPHMVVVPDYEAHEQLPTVLSRVHELRKIGTPEILIVPKFRHAVLDIPSDCIVAVSMPAPSYAGFLPDFRLLKDRRCHLLGGRPDSTKTRIGQAEAIRKITGAGGQVVSVDGNYSARAGQVGRWFDGGKWQQTRSKTVDTVEIQAHSLSNIIDYLRGAFVNSQPMLI